jgi:hypothetical protein
MLCLASSVDAQITSFDQSAIYAVMTGPGPTSTGECAGTLDPTSGALDLTCTHDVAGGRTVITRGHPDNNIQLFDLGTGVPAEAHLVLNETQVARLLTGALWIAVESGAFPLGEVFSRLLVKTPIGESVMRFPLTNQDMVTTPSTATGTCALRIRAGSGPITLLCVHDVANAANLRLFIDGGQVKNVGGVDSPFEIDMPELRANFGRFLEGDYGVILTSGAFPAGEIGQVLDRCIESPTTLCLTGERFRVGIQFTRPGLAPAAAKSVPPRSDDSGLFWFFSPSNWEVLVKVLNPCGLNSDNFWVFLSANTNVAFTATIFDTATGRVKTYSNPQGQVAATVADTAAFPCN